MRAEKNNTAAKLTVWSPTILGGIGLMLCLPYQAQRDGLIGHVSHPFGRFIQHHLDAFAGFGALASLLGMLLGLIVLRRRGQSSLATIGTGLSVIALLYSIFGLSL